MRLITWLKEKFKILFNGIKILFICLRHGINPFSSVGKNTEKVSARFSENEKQFYINACKSEYAKEYLRGVFYGNE